MALDLFILAEQGRQLWMAYSRRREDYSAALTRYLRPDVTYTAATEAADFLVASGYAEGRRGSWTKADVENLSGGFGYRSRLRPTDKFVQLFHREGVTREDIFDEETTELIRLKGPPEGPRGLKPLMTYVDTEDTHRMRDGIRTWAKLVNTHQIVAADRQAADAGREIGPDDEQDGEFVDPTEAALYRVFNDGLWTAGGRFYGGWWQSLPKAIRRTITIDGEPTVELDFKSLHPRMLYHLSHRPLDPQDDPYVLGEEWREVDRNLVKVAFNQLLAINGTGNPKRPKNAGLPKGRSYKALVDAIEQRHWQVAGWFRGGRAVRLQNLDSMIAETVLDVFTRSVGRPVLPVHDSFIVAARDEEQLGYTMSCAYRDHLARSTKIEAYPPISGWSSDEVAAAVQASLADGDDL